MRSTARVPPERRVGPFGSLLGTLWTLPTNVLGHVAGRLVARGTPPARVRGTAATAALYPIRRRGLGWVGAVTLGHVVLHRPGIFDGERGRWILAHELAHTRQHDVLGPAYLPAHALLQALSALVYAVVRPGRSDAVHAYNPLEQTFLALGADAYDDVAAGRRLSEHERRLLLERLIGRGVEAQRTAPPPRVSR